MLFNVYIPTDDEFNPNQYTTLLMGKFTPQPDKGLLKDIRTPVMSSSDKLLKWNFMGVQGSLLSVFMRPVFMESVVLGTRALKSLFSKHASDFSSNFSTKLKLIFPKKKVSVEHDRF